MKTIIYKTKTLALGTLFTMLITTNISKSQDTLHFRNGSVVIGKVTEITEIQIKYKKSENLTGPTYTELKNDLASINYNNGTNETFQYQAPVQPIAKKEAYYVPKAPAYPSLKPFGATKFMYNGAIIGNREMHSILLNLNDPKITSHIKLAKKQAAGQYIGFGFFPCAIAAMAIASQPSSNGPSSNNGYLNDEIAGSVVMGALGVACFATSITLKVKRSKNEAAALKLYQQKYQ